MPCPSRSRAHFFAVSHSGEAPSGIGCRRRHSACSGEKTQGDVISNPGRRLALCVAPYFADRGVGDMRGPPNGVPNMPPRRWWQAVIAPHNHVVHKMIHTAPRRKHSPAPPPGCDCVQERFGTPRMSPRPRVAKYGVTHSCHHLRGGGNARLRSSSPLLAEWADAAHSMHSTLVLDDDGGVLCSQSRADASLRPVLRCFGCALGVLGGLWAQKNRCLSIDSK